MADFYLDHDVAIRVAPALRDLGHTAITPRDLGTERANDADHLLGAATDSRVLVTHNAKDFMLLHHAWELWQTAWLVAAPHSGILVLPHGTLADNVQRLVAFVGTPRAPIAGQLHRWQSGGWTMPRSRP